MTPTEESGVGSRVRFQDPKADGRQVRRPWMVSLQRQLEEDGPEIADRSVTSDDMEHIWETNHNHFLLGNSVQDSMAGTGTIQSSLIQDASRYVTEVTAATRP